MKKLFLILALVASNSQAIVVTKDGVQYGTICRLGNRTTVYDLTDKLVVGASCVVINEDGGYMGVGKVTKE